MSEVRVVDDPGELDRFFGDAPEAHIYALADLEAPFWEPSTWYRRGEAVVGFVRLPDGDDTTIYAVATRDPHATLGLLAQLLPLIEPGTLITAPTGLGEMLLHEREVAWEGPHVRYVLDDARTALDALHTTAGAGDYEVVSLDSEDLEELSALYASDPGAAFFLPHMLDNRSSVGVYDNGLLVAAAGTHVVSDDRRCAAIGSVYVRPSHRGRSLGTAVTAGVVARIVDRVDLIGLNVAADNGPAIAAYRQLGFRPVLTYAEAEVR